jgi:uncharacterized membrane protein SirB2
MLITIILIAHLTLAALVVAGFSYRYFMAFKRKSYPATGQGALLGGSTMLVISGITLSILSKVAITNLCLESLGLIVALFVMEFGLKMLGNGLEEHRVVSKD